MAHWPRTRAGGGVGAVRGQAGDAERGDGRQQLAVGDVALDEIKLAEVR
jgi:hypothetical protein